jgi:hypothetical protein
VLTDKVMPPVCKGDAEPTTSFRTRPAGQFCGQFWERSQVMITQMLAQMLGHRNTFTDAPL